MTIRLSPIIDCFDVCRFVLVGLASLALVGCGSHADRGRIFGKITFQGQPVSEGIVLLCEASKGVNMSAAIKPDGSYEIITMEGEGLPTGTYRVSVCPPPEIPYMGPPGTQPKPKLYPNIPKKYRRYETADLSLTVKQGKNPFDIDMKP
jgi:hypothetical protein